MSEEHNIGYLKVGDKVHVDQGLEGSFEGILIEIDEADGDLPYCVWNGFGESPKYSWHSADVVTLVARAVYHEEPPKGEWCTHD